MIVGLKKSVPFVIQDLPEVTFNGAWLYPQKLLKILKLCQMQDFVFELLFPIIIPRMLMHLVDY